MLELDTNIRPIYAHSIEEFNSYVDKYKCDTEMILTKSGNLSQVNLRRMPCYKVWKRGNRMELHYMAFDKTFIHIRVIYALHYDVGSDTDDKLAYEALTYFKGLMDVIPTDDKESDCEFFTCPENPESAYYNYIDDRWTDMKVNHCYSLDRNNSFPASMEEVYPQVEKVQQEIKIELDKINEQLKRQRDAIRAEANVEQGKIDAQFNQQWKEIEDKANIELDGMNKQLERLKQQKEGIKYETNVEIDRIDVQLQQLMQ